MPTLHPGHTDSRCPGAVPFGCCPPACVRVSLWEVKSRPWQNTFLPFLVPVQDGSLPTEGASWAGLCLMCVCAAFGRGSGRRGVLRLFPSPLSLPHVRACVCVCAGFYFRVCVFVPALRWVMTQRKDSEHTVLNSTEGPRDKYNSAQHFFFTPLSFSLTIRSLSLFSCLRLHSPFSYCLLISCVHLYAYFC